MSSSAKGFSNSKDARSTQSNKATTLNPNAEEFVPSSIRSTCGSTRNMHSNSLDLLEAPVKAVLDRAESSTSNNTDDEAHRFWQRQLPDDITPDFNDMGANAISEHGYISLTGLSVHDSAGTSRFSRSAASHIVGANWDASFGRVDLGLLENLRYSGSAYAGDLSSGNFMASAGNPWDERVLNGDQHLIDRRELLWNNVKSRGRFLNGIGDGAALQDRAINRSDLLASQFPNFSAEGLPEMFANGFDLNSTIRIPPQHKLQVDGDFTQNMNSKFSTSPNITSLDFLAFPLTEAQSGLSKFPGDDMGQGSTAYHLASNVLGGASDFASTVQKLTSQGSGHWNYDRNGSADERIGSNRISQLLASTKNVQGKSVYGDKMQSARAAQAAPVCLETGEALASMHSEGICDSAHCPHAYFDKRSRVQLIGNDALARELYSKGKFYEVPMKRSHVKTKEGISHQSILSSEIHTLSRGREWLIDLYHYHDSDAPKMLKLNLGNVKRFARSVGQQVQVLICLGRGHHTEGRLPVGIEQCLLDENLHYTQPYPGLVRVVIS